MEHTTKYYSLLAMLFTSFCTPLFAGAHISTQGPRHDDVCKQYINALVECKDALSAYKKELKTDIAKMMPLVKENIEPWIDEIWHEKKSLVEKIIREREPIKQSELQDYENKITIRMKQEQAREKALIISAVLRGDFDFAFRTPRMCGLRAAGHMLPRTKNEKINEYHIENLLIKWQRKLISYKGALEVEGALTKYNCRPTMPIIFDHKNNQLSMVVEKAKKACILRQQLKKATQDAFVIKISGKN